MDACAKTLAASTATKRRARRSDMVQRVWWLLEGESESERRETRERRQTREKREMGER